MPSRSQLDSSAKPVVKNDESSSSQGNENEEEETQESPTILALKLMHSEARIEELQKELDSKRKKEKSEKKRKKMGGDQLEHLCLQLPIHLMQEEIVLLSKQGSVFDDIVVKEALMLGFTTSRQVREDAVDKIRRSLEGYTARKVNIFTYEQTRLDNSLLWERPSESIEI